MASDDAKRRSWVVSHTAVRDMLVPVSIQVSPLMGLWIAVPRSGSHAPVILVAAPPGAGYDILRVLFTHLCGREEYRSRLSTILRVEACGLAGKCGRREWAGNFSMYKIDRKTADAEVGV